MFAEESKADHSPPLLPCDAWVFAKALAGQDVEAETNRVSVPNRPLAKRVAVSPIEGRGQVWNNHLAMLSEVVAEAWIEAVVAINPDDPAPEDETWGQPLSFKLPPVEPFPLDIYPAPVVRLIRQGSKAINCPLDFLAVPALVVAGAAIGRSASLRLKDGYFAPASVYAACVGQPGDGKSPAVGAVVRPMQHSDEAQFEAWKKEKDAFGSFQAGHESAGRAARRGRPKRQKEDGELSEEDEANPPESVDLDTPTVLVKPILKRSVVGDITTEAMDVIMEPNPRGLLQILDEASTLTSSMNQYRGGKGSDRQWYMSTWSGQARMVDRKGNAENVPIRVPHPFLCIVGGMVPDMIGSFCDEKGRHDGFIDRLLFTYPEPVPKNGWWDGGIRDEVASEWSEVVARLQARQLIVENQKARPHVVQFNEEGKLAWAGLIDAHHAEQRSTDFSQSLVGPWAKLEQYAGRITLILHMLSLAADPTRDSHFIPDVTARTVRNAGRLLSYFKSHTRRVHEAMRARARGDEGSDDVQCILKWVLRHRHESFSVRDLNRDLTRTFGKRARALEEALDWLAKRHWIRLEAEPETATKKKRGRSKSRAFLVNPHLFASQNCQNHEPSSGAPHLDHSPSDIGNFATGSVEIVGKEDGHDRLPF